MKSIPLKTIGKEKTEFKYKETLLSLLGRAPVGAGFTIDEVRLSVKIIEKIEKAKDKFELEGDEYQYLKKVLGRAKFSRASKELVEFIDDING